MASWQLVNLGTRCTVTHCRIALWSHQSAQTASSERCIMQIVPAQSIRVLNRMCLERKYIYIYTPEQYKEKLDINIQNMYKKAIEYHVTEINTEAKKITEELEISDNLKHKSQIIQHFVRRNGFQQYDTAAPNSTQ